MMSPDRQEPMEYRTVVQKTGLLICRGPRETGPAARARDELVARVRLDRFWRSTCEAILRGLSGEFAATVADAIDADAGPPRLTSAQLAHKQAQIAEIEATITELEGLVEQASSRTRDLLERDIRQNRTQADRLVLEITRGTARSAIPEPVTEVEVADLFRVLAQGATEHTRLLAPGSEVFRDAAADVIVGPILRKVEDLTVHFEVGVRLPTADGKTVFTDLFPMTVENISKLKGDRLELMANECFRRAIPTSLLAAGIPLEVAACRHDKLTAAVSRILRPLVGSKAASMIAASEAPEVLAVIARHFDLAEPTLRVEEDLERRVLDTYVNGSPPGPKAWLQATDDADISRLVVEVHSAGSAAAVDIKPWQRRYLHRRGESFVSSRCECGSGDLAYIAAPEPDGLVCLRCRRDQSGLIIPDSWNAAVRNRDYWEKLGYCLDVPTPPGLRERMLVTDPLHLRDGTVTIKEGRQRSRTG